MRLGYTWRRGAHSTDYVRRRDKDEKPEEKGSRFSRTRGSRREPRVSCMSPLHYPLVGGRDSICSATTLRGRVHARVRGGTDGLGEPFQRLRHQDGRGVPTCDDRIPIAGSPDAQWLAPDLCRRVGSEHTADPGPGAQRVVCWERWQGQYAGSQIPERAGAGSWRFDVTMSLTEGANMILFGLAAMEQLGVDVVAHLRGCYEQDPAYPVGAGRGMHQVVSFLGAVGGNGCGCVRSPAL